jgi:hypothetical protein
MQPEAVDYMTVFFRSGFHEIAGVSIAIIYLGGISLTYNFLIR